jgi:hypothetical protein
MPNIIKSNLEDTAVMVPQSGPCRGTFGYTRVQTHMQTKSRCMGTYRSSVDGIADAVNA